MSFPELEKLAPFESRPYEPDQLHDVKILSNDDWHADDLFGEEPESIRFHAGSITHTGDLVLSDIDEYGYYIVDGNLDIGGVFRINYSELYNVLVVTGNLTAKALVLAGDCQLYVVGTTVVEGSFLTTLSDGAGCYFRGATTAEALLRIGDRCEPVFAELAVRVSSPSFRADYAESPSEHFEAMCSDLCAGKSILA